VDQNLRGEEFRGLSYLFRMPDRSFSESVSLKEYFSFYDEKIKEYTDRQLYAVFFWHWLRALLCALSSKSKIINTSKLSADLLYRRETELLLLKNFLYVDFDDCSVPSVDVECLKESELDIIEATIVRMHGDQLRRYRSELLRQGLDGVFSALSEPDIFDSLDEFSAYLSASPGSKVPAHQMRQRPGEVRLTLVDGGETGKTRFGVDGMELSMHGKVLLTLSMPRGLAREDARFALSLKVRCEGTVERSSLFLEATINGGRPVRLFRECLTPVAIVSIPAEGETIGIAVEGLHPDEGWILMELTMEPLNASTDAVSLKSLRASMSASGFR
jgi:hypothetical protein